MTKRDKSKHKKQSQQSSIQTLSKRDNVTKPKSRFARFLDERNKRIKKLPPVQDPAVRAGQILVGFFTITLFLSWSAFWDRFSRIVPSWLALIWYLALLVVGLSRLYWMIFIPDDRKWLRYRGFMDWVFVSVTLFFYFYGTGAYYATLDVLSTRILPFVSQKVNEVIANLFGWTVSGLIGNAAYDGLKRLIKMGRRDERVERNP